jgi:chromosome segregation ATPase
MAKDRIKNLVLVLLLGIAIFSMIRYVMELKERFRLQESLTQSQSQVASLVQEKQNLLQELGKEQELNAQLADRNTGLRAYLKASKGRMTRLFQDNAKANEDLEKANTKFSILKAENTALIGIHRRIYTENEQFKFRLGSIVELRKAIKELKSRKRKDLGLEMQGNQGFLTKNGRLTSEKVKIEVVPVSSAEPAKN